MAETLSTRVTRLEEAMTRLANAEAHLAEVQVSIRRNEPLRWRQWTTATPTEAN